MIDSIDAMTARTLALALDAATLRHQAIAANIANLDTEGYMPLTVAFEAQLEQARSSLRERGSVDAASLSHVQAALLPRTDEVGVPTHLQLDAEIAAMAQNSVQYQALVSGLSRYIGILNVAVGDGRR